MRLFFLIQKTLTRFPLFSRFAERQTSMPNKRGKPADCGNQERFFQGLSLSLSHSGPVCRSFTPSALSSLRAFVRSFLPRREFAFCVFTEIVEVWKRAHLLVPSRYLMVRVKSPITQLPRRIHAYTATRVHAVQRMCIVNIKAPDLTTLDPVPISVYIYAYVHVCVCAHANLYIDLCMHVLYTTERVRETRSTSAFALPSLMPSIASDLLSRLSRPERASC